jgi:hypothetical protein
MESMHRPNRRVLISLVSGALLAVPFAPVAQAAGGPCDPPAYCPPAVRPFDGPGGPSSGSQSNPQPVNPAPANLQPANSQPAASQPATNAGSASASPSLKVSPGSAAVGAPIVVTGSAYSIPGRSDIVFINVQDSNGINFDTRSKEIKCVETDDAVLIFYQMFGLGCSADGGGPMIHTDKDGTFRAVVNVPSGITPGAGAVCASSPNGRACTPFTITAGSPPPAPQPQPAPQPNPPAPAPDTVPAVDPATTAALQQAIQGFNDAYTQTIANQDASLMADVVTSDVLQAAAGVIQKAADAGVVSTSLQSLDWGPITVSGTTARVSDHEIWSVTFDDGSTSTQDNTFAYSLVLDGGTWKIQATATQ